MGVRVDCTGNKNGAAGDAPDECDPTCKGNVIVPDIGTDRGTFTEVCIGIPS